MNIEAHWEQHSEHMKRIYETEGINGIGYGLSIKEDDNDDKYFLLTLSGGGEGGSSILFHVGRDVLWLGHIEYELFDNYKYHRLDVTEDDFAFELWEILTDSGTTQKLWDEWDWS